MAYYGNADLNMLETCLNSLRMRCKSAKIFIITDGFKEQSYIANKYRAEFLKLPRERFKDRRALLKIEELQYYMQGCSFGDQIVVADVDILFLGNPISAFSYGPSFDIGITTRDYKYYYPINAGIFFLTVNKKTKEFMRFHVEQSTKATWPPYMKFRKKFNHERYGHDWTVGQDFLNVAWQQRKILNDKMIAGLTIRDLGCRFNYCPARDVIGEAGAQDKILEMYAANKITRSPIA